MNGFPRVSGRAPVLFAFVLTAVLAACTDPTLVREDPGEEPPPKPGVGMLAAGVYEFTVTGVGTENMSATAKQLFDGAGTPVAPTGAQAALSVVTGLAFENVTTTNFWEGTRTEGGQRYITITYRVRNSSGGPISNVTLVPNMSATTIPGTPWTALTLYDGSPASSSIAYNIVPSGAMALNETSNVSSLFPDVLQVFTEAEIAAIPLPAGVTGFFPYGFVIRNRLNPNTRTIPAAADANDYGGVLTFSFRFPMTAASTSDPFRFSFQATAILDSETRVTESIEEGSDPDARAKVMAKATALGATTVTILNGSPAADPAVPDYPGQRQICGVRTAGDYGSPINYITTPGAYSRIALLYPGETLNSCAPYFRSGTAGRPATNVGFPVTLIAMDRYGNQKTDINEGVRLESVGGPAFTAPAPTAFASGSTSMTITFHDYGMATLVGVGARLRDARPSSVFGITRTWTAGAGTTDWHTGGNWGLGAVPMSQDSVIIPLSAPLDPVLAANVSVQSVLVEDGAIIDVNAFDLAAAGDVYAGIAGGQGILNTTGRLILAGTAKTVQGRLPRLRVTGTYSLTGNVTARAPLEVAAGRLTDAAYRVQIESF